MTSTLLTCTSSTRPGSPSTGDTLFETDTNKIITWDGTVWRAYLSDGTAVEDSDITDLSPHLWLDPSYADSFFTDSGKGTPVTADGERVGCYADRSGNDFDFVQSTQTDKPTLCLDAGVGSVASLVYSNSDQLDFVGTSGSEITAENITIFFVWRLPQEGNYYFVEGTTNSNNPRLRLDASGDNLKYYWGPFGSADGGAAGVSFSSTALAPENFSARHIYCLKTSSGDDRTYTYHNGGADIAGSTLAPTGVFLEEAETLKLFKGLYNYWSPHWLFEFLVFNSSLSDADVNTVNSYLGNKHSVAVTDVS
tara:strand:+ start:21 stop:944 length:924 start_codon:yes stop_codon:yes gene_type:complete